MELLFEGLKFLSRLCGGELGYYIIDNGLFFLSRLCGGEYPHHFQAIQW